MKVKLLYVVLLLIVMSCKQSNITSQSLEGKILTSKTILFEQQMDGIMISRPVIIETSVDIDNQKSYPILIAINGRGAQAYSSSDFLSGISDIYSKKIFPEIKNYFWE